MHAITQLLTGSTINTNPGEEVMKNIVETINNLGFIQTYIENSPTDTFLYRNENRPELEDWEGNKRALYANYSLKHWTGEW
jgi:hypothetical protein